MEETELSQSISAQIGHYFQNYGKKLLKVVQCY